jgi:hypothetical protein
LGDEVEILSKVLSHKPKVKTNDDDDSQYATGWFVTKDNQETLIYHPGTLENFRFVCSFN